MTRTAVFRIKNPSIENCIALIICGYVNSKPMHPVAVNEYNMVIIS
jgi:hypothetical protein